MFSIYDGRDSFYQWDLDRKLVVKDSSIKQVHFCNKTDDCSLIVETYQDGELTLANVPNILLTENWRINVFAYDDNYTKFSDCFKVIARSKPADYVYTETEVMRWQELEADIRRFTEEVTTAYDIAVKYGYEGTEQEWITLLQNSAANSADEAKKAAQAAEAARADTEQLKENVVELSNSSARNAAAAEQAKADTLTSASKALLYANEAEAAANEANEAKTTASKFMSTCDTLRNQAEHFAERASNIAEAADAAATRAEAALVNADAANTTATNLLDTLDNLRYQTSILRDNAEANRKKAEVAATNAANSQVGAEAAATRAEAAAKRAEEAEDNPGGSGADVDITNSDFIALLVEEDFLPAVFNADGRILTDSNNNVILRY